MHKISFQRFRFISLLALILGVITTVVFIGQRQNIFQHASTIYPVYLGMYASGTIPTDIIAQQNIIGNNPGLSIIMWYQSWGQSWPGNSNQFQSAWMDTVRKNGSFPLITWEPWDTWTGANPTGPCTEHDPSQPTPPPCSLQNITKGVYDTYIDAWAAASKAWGHPYFLRFAHEMNGTWYPWGNQPGNTPQDYINAWTHVHDRFVNIDKVTNVTWVWSPNVSSANPMQYYPGPQYVDWVAMDGYNWGKTKGGGWTSLHDVFNTTYNYIQGTGKPVMIAETGSVENVEGTVNQGGDKATWISDGFAQGLPIPMFPNVKAVIWFSVNYTSQPTQHLAVDSSDASKNAFISAIQNPYYATKNTINLDRSPIQPADPISVSLPAPTNPIPISHTPPTPSTIVVPSPITIKNSFDCNENNNGHTAFCYLGPSCPSGTSTHNGTFNGCSPYAICCDGKRPVTTSPSSGTKCQAANGICYFNLGGCPNGRTGTTTANNDCQWPQFCCVPQATPTPTPKAIRPFRLRNFFF